MNLRELFQLLNTSKGSPSPEDETFERSSLEVSYESKTIIYE